MRQTVWPAGVPLEGLSPQILPAAADPELFEKVKRGEVTVEAAVNSLQPVPPGDAVERQYNALMKAWDGAASEARQRFLDSVTGS